MANDSRERFLHTLLKRFDTLRAVDRLPESAEAWQSQRTALRQHLLASLGDFPTEKCPLEPRVLGELARDGYRVEKVVFQTLHGVLMTANAYVPQGEGKRPAVLCVHGHWKGAKQDPVPQARCIGLAKLGFFVLAVDAFGAGERGIGKALGEYHGEMTGATLLPLGMPLPGLQVYENMRAVDYLQSRPEVDGTRIGITGASGGGNQTMYAGALDERFGCVVPTCSVGTYRSYLGAACCVCELVPDAMTYTEEWAILALVAPRALLVQNATRDAFQFSVGEAQQSIAKAQHVYRLQGHAGKIAHTIFESGHDYNRPMREAMYGWMTLHLKGEGQGNPIPEPPVQPEDPETLRCYPGETRPDDFMTLPRFAAQQAAKQIAEHRAAWPTHLEMWKTHTLQTRQILRSGVLGGGDWTDWRVSLLEETKTDGMRRLRYQTEPGLELTLLGQPGARGRGTYLVLDLAGSDHARTQPLVQELEQGGATVWCADLRASGRHALAGDTIGKAPDHNSAEWSIWTGRPLLGQWIADAAVAVEAVHRHSQQPTEGSPAGSVTVVGLGPASMIALGVGIYDPRVQRVVMVQGLASFRTETPYTGQWMGLFAPGILRDAGDIPQLAALLAPRKLVIAGGVRGDGTALAPEALRDAWGDTRSIYRLQGVEGHLAFLDEPPGPELARRLQAGE
jgi:dienelactone hydrolase